MATEVYYSAVLGEGNVAYDLGRTIAEYGGGITDISLDSGSQNTITTTTGLDRYGTTFVDSSLVARNIVISFFIMGITHEDAMNIQHALTGMSDIASQKRTKLTLNGDRNKYYKVVSAGPPAFDYNPSERTATGSFTFISHDRFATSEYIKTLTKETKDDSIGSIVYDEKRDVTIVNVNNQGNMETWPVIKISTPTENGYIGIVNQNGVMQLGNPDAQYDGTASWNGGTMAETLLEIKTGDNTDTGWGQFKHVTNRLYSPLTPTVSIDPNAKLVYKEEGGGAIRGLQWDKHLTGSYDANRWAGAAKVHELKKDNSNFSGSRDFRCDFNIRVWEDRSYQVGFFEIIFCDEYDNPICAYDLAKNNIEHNGQMAVKFWINDKIIDSRNIFGPNNNEPGQKYPNVAFNWNKGDATVVKEGGKVTFYYNGVPFSFTDPSIEDRICSKIYLVSGTYPSQRIKGDIHFMSLQSISFQKLNARRYDLTPNLFKPNTGVIVDNYRGEVSIVSDSTDTTNRGTISQGILSLGSDFFTIPTGKSDIEIHTSSFSKAKPDVVVEWNERWL